MHDSAFLTETLSKHGFVEDPGDDFRCARCQLPRAMHDTRDTFTTTRYHAKKAPKEGDL